MPRAENKTRKLLKVERGCERSRLEGQLLAAAYDLATPLLRRALPGSAADQPIRPRTAIGAAAPARTGGSHA
jgi:hypothetical protein